MSSRQRKMLMLAIVIAETLAVVGWYGFGGRPAGPALSLGQALPERSFIPGLPVLIGPEWVLFAARLVLGSVMLYYGWQKVRDLKSNRDDFVSMGFRPAWLWGTIVAFNEFFGGLAMISGIVPELFAATFGFQMLMGAFWKRKVNKPFSDYSYDLLALVTALFIMLNGGGALVPVPFDAFPLLRPDLVMLAVAAALFGAGMSRPATH